MNPYAWPTNWRTDGEYLRLYDKLAFQYGHERAHKITLGSDASTNRDIDSWANLGANAMERGR